MRFRASLALVEAALERDPATALAVAEPADGVRDYEDIEHFRARAEALLS